MLRKYHRRYVRSDAKNPMDELHRQTAAQREGDVEFHDGGGEGRGTASIAIEYTERG